MNGYLTFSHDDSSWLVRTPGFTWAPITAAQARDYFDRGYIVLDAI